MKSVLVLAFAAIALAGTPTNHRPAHPNPLSKRSLGSIHISKLLGRDFLSCEDTYGGGSVTCGDSTSHDCYDPSMGQSCCLLDNGYCDQGDFCAPVAGFCCHDVRILNATLIFIQSQQVIGRRSQILRCSARFHPPIHLYGLPCIYWYSNLIFVLEYWISRFHNKRWR
jgi:hypothetical protein